ncbi:MAG: HAD hydrolase-like protein, partial [Candidatus Hodarchaeales archaeon]
MHDVSYILFDFDGTIVDSMGFLENNAVDLLTTYYDFSISEARRLYRETTGLPFVQQIEIISPNTPDLNKKVNDLFEKLKIDRIFEQRLFPDSFTVLKELNGRGYKIGISSGTFEHIVTEYFSKCEMT